MKSHRTSYGIFCLTLSAFIMCSSLGCALKTRQDQRQDGGAKSEAAKVGVSTLSETSLADDRDALAELRKDIPEEKRQSNDELKEVLSLTGELKDPPSRIREKFNRLNQRSREQHRRESQKLREAYNRFEKKNRDEFKRQSDIKRKEFNESKKERDERKEFYDELDRQSREFFADERDKRNLFNSEVRQREDDFNYLIRDRQKDFNLEIKSYEDRYRQWQKELKEKKTAKPGAAPAQQTKEIDL